jgi:hypothetical protein
MVPALRPEPHARSIVKPQPPPRPLFLGYLQPFATPDSVDSILANSPVSLLQQRRDAPVTTAPKLTGQLDDCSGESIFVFTLCRLMALRAAWLVHQSARPPFTHSMFAGMVNRNASSFRA